MATMEERLHEKKPIRTNLYDFMKGDPFIDDVAVIGYRIPSRD